MSEPWPFGSMDKVMAAQERDTSDDTVDNRAMLELARRVMAVPCSNPEPHDPSGHYWTSTNGEFWCNGIPEPDEVPPTGMAALQVWLTQDYECNGVEIEMNCTGADYEDDDTPEGQHEVRWNYAYEITLHEIGLYGSGPGNSTGDSSWTVYKHVGFGATMDEAADQALAVMREHYENVVKPPMVINPS